MQITGLIEVILYVENMARMVAFYRNVLGLAILEPAGMDPAEAYWVTFATGSCTLALHGGGQRRLGEDAPKIVFGVPDLDAARAQLLQKETDLGAIRAPAPGVRVCDGRDPEGNLFSLEEHSAA